MSENIIKKDRFPEFLTLMNSFSQEEMKSFQRFVESPYFNRDEKVVTLLLYLKNSFFKDKSKQYNDKTRRKIYKMLFSDDKEVKTELTPQQQGRLNKKFSILSDCGRSFLLNESLKKESPQKYKLLYEQLIDRKLSRYFKKYQNKHRKELEDVKVRNIEYYLKKYQVEWNKGDYQFKHEIDVAVKNDNLKEVVETFDIYCIIKRMRIELVCIAFMGITKKSYDLEIVKPILSLANLSQYRDIPIVAVYRTAYEMEIIRLKTIDTILPDSELDNYHKESKKYFDILLELLHKHEDILSQDVKIDIFTIATNFCAHQMKYKNLVYSKRVFELFQYLEDNQMLAPNGKILLSKLNTAITFACQNQKFEWAKEILEKYKDSILESSYTDSVYNFNLGQIAFHQKSYAEADYHFLKVELADANYFYFINCKILRLKCLYELGHLKDENERVNHESVDRVFKSAKEYIRTNNLLSPTDKQGYKNFINALITIYNIRHGLGKATIEKLNEKLEKQSVNSDKQWLTEKIAELKSNQN